MTHTQREKKIRVFYDGKCGLCHFFVRFALARMSPKRPLYFSPIGGKTFKRVAKNFSIKKAAGSVIFYNEKEQLLLFKTKAVIAILQLFSKPWQGLGWLLQKIPQPIADRGYDFVAKVRRKIFRRPANFCPTVSKQWHAYFEN